MAARLADHIRASERIRLAWPTQANEVFAIMKKSVSEKLHLEGAVFYDWNPPHSEMDRVEEGETFARFVTSFATSEDEVDRFGELIA
jgi:threonine aldolase